MDTTTGMAAEGLSGEIVANLLDQLSDIAHDVHSLSFWLLVAAVALVVIACRMPRRCASAGARQTGERSARNYAQELRSGVGKTFEIVSKDGTAAFGGVPTARVTVLDCDGTWALVAPANPSARPNQPVKLAIRVDQIAGLKEIAA